MKFCANSFLLCRTNFHREFFMYPVDGLSLKNVVIGLSLLRMRLAWYFRCSLKISLNRAKTRLRNVPRIGNIELLQMSCCLYVVYDQCCQTCSRSAANMSEDAASKPALQRLGTFTALSTRHHYKQKHAWPCAHAHRPATASGAAGARRTTRHRCVRSTR